MQRVGTTVTTGHLVGILVTATVITGVTVPLFRRLALRLHVVDHPAVRKLHTDPVPLLGGVAMCGAVFVSLLLAPERRELVQLGSILGGALWVSAWGLWDDRRPLPPAVKLASQVAAAVLLAVSGVEVHLGVDTWINIAITLTWIVGITNSINLLDNMDGLAAGVAAVAASCFALMAAANGQYLVGAMSAALLGACLGFLFFNFNPASIFMGDSGSLFLGFLLAALGIKLRFPDNVATVTWMVPVLVLGVAVFDTTLVVVSRIRRHLNPLTTPGRDHASHRLVALGWTPREAVMIHYLFGCALAWVAVLVSLSTPVEAYAISAAVAAASVIAIGWLDRGWSRRPLGCTREPRGMTSTAAPRQVLVTGGAGFIGSHLTESLLARGDGVTILDDLSTGRMANIAHLESHDRFRIVVDTVTSESVLESLVSECDLVIHLAAAVGVELIVRDPLRVIESNIIGTHAVLAAARRHRRKVLLASSSEIYGKNGALPMREDDDRLLGPTTRSRWCYSTSKAAGEYLALASHRQTGLPVVIMRFFNTVGPRQRGTYGMVVPRFVSQALAREPLTVFGNGRQSRCFCDVSDVVAAVVALADHDGAAGSVFNVGSTNEITILDLARRVLAVVRGGEPPEDLDALVAAGLVTATPFEEAYEAGFEDMVRRIPDVGRLHRLIGWRPRVSLDDTIRRIVGSITAEPSG